MLQGHKQRPSSDVNILCMLHIFKWFKLLRDRNHIQDIRQPAANRKYELTVILFFSPSVFLYQPPPKPLEVFSFFFCKKKKK